MSRSNRTFIGLTLAFAAMLVVADTASAQNPNFAGNWTLNTSESELPQAGGGGRGGMGGGASATMAVTHDVRRSGLYRRRDSENRVHLPVGRRSATLETGGCRLVRVPEDTWGFPRGTEAPGAGPVAVVCSSISATMRPTPTARDVTASALWRALRPMAMRRSGCAAMSASAAASWAGY